MEAHAVDYEPRVTPLELFFDLVFVFAITQVTGLLSVHPTWPGLAKGMLVLARDLVGVGRLRVDDQRGGRRRGLVPRVDLRRDGRDARGRAGGSARVRRDALVFGVAYVFVRLLHVVIYAGVADAGIAGAAIRRLAPTLALARP